MSLYADRKIRRYSLRMTKWISSFRRSGIAKRMLSLCLALAMLVALVPVATQTVHAAQPGDTLYLKPNSNWTQAGARFAAYFFGAGTTWVGMTDTDGDGYYEVTIPTGGYTSVIFCRMNPAATENNWDNKWNQTGDLTIPADDTNCYTVADGTWGDSGSWSVYTPAGSGEETEPVTDVTIHYRNTGAWTTVNGYVWDAVSGATYNGAWPGSELTENAEHDNWYTLTLSGMNAAGGIGVIFNNGSDKTSDISITANG